MAFLYRLQPPRPTFAQDMSEAEAAVMERHIAYWQDLLTRGAALAFGPVLDPDDPWAGVCTYGVVPMELVKPG
jgi:uncharacterized protein